MSALPPTAEEVKLVCGADLTLAQLCSGFNRGFSDYKYGARFDQRTLARFLALSGIQATDCAALVVREGPGWTGAGVALLAIADGEAWCGGLAVASAYRRRGWAQGLMDVIRSRAEQAGARSLRLEVLAANEPARALYRRLGYREERELLIWERPPRQGALPIPFERLQATDPAQILATMHVWHDLTPVWQRRSHFLRHQLPQLHGYTIDAKDGQPVAYVLCRHAPQGEGNPHKLQLVDIAVDPTADLLMAGRPLLQALQLHHMESTLALVNEPADSRLNRVLAALGFYVIDRQYELVLSL